MRNAQFRFRSFPYCPHRLCSHHRRIRAFHASAAASAASARQLADELLDLLVGGLSVLAHHANEVERLAGIGVVGVERHAVGFDLHDLGHKAVVLSIRQGDDGTRIDILFVEFPVDGECLAPQFVYTFRHVFAEGLCGLQGEVEVRPRLQARHVALKGVERDAEARDELEGTLARLLL